MIINMADKMKDAEDLKLESLFASDSVPDNGFSTRIEKRIRRKLWVRRLSLPIAAAIGAAIAIQPLTALLNTMAKFFVGLTSNLDVGGQLGGVSVAGLPSITTIVLGLGLAALVFIGTQALAD